MGHTIKDIARLAGVSRGTVDRIMHDRGPVAKTTYDKVMGVLNKINYKPNLVGRSLKRNKKIRIAIFIPNYRKDKYWEEVVKGIRLAGEEFQAFGIDTDETYYTSDNIDVFRAQEQMILDSSPDAVLMVPIFLEESISFMKNCAEKGIQVVYINTPLVDVESAFYVGTQQKLSGRVAANLYDTYLENGNILVLHMEEKFENSIHMQRKEKGFREYFKENPDSKRLIESVSLIDDDTKLTQIVNEFVNQNTQKKGIFVSGSYVYKVAKILKDNNVDAFLIGYDLISENIDFLKQGIIKYLIHENPRNQGYLSIKYLAEYFLIDKEMQPNSYLPLDIVSKENYKLYLSAH